MKYFSIAVLITSTMSFLMSSPTFAEDIELWTYHEFPPFIINEKKKTGLSYDLADLLTKRSKGEHEFRLQVVPRERINNRLNAKDPAMVLWVNPNWFGDKDRTKYLWSNALLQDSNSVISPKSRPIEFDGNESIVGKKLVAVRGHKYDGINRLVTEGKINRVDVDTEVQAIRMIASQRADASIIASSAARYFVKSLDLHDTVHISGTTQSDYERFILVQPQLQPLQSFLNTFVDNIPNDETWQKLLAKYGL